VCSSQDRTIFSKKTKNKNQTKNKNKAKQKTAIRGKHMGKFYYTLLSGNPPIKCLHSHNTDFIPDAFFNRQSRYYPKCLQPCGLKSRGAP
jgi:hypothetical protein